MSESISLTVVLPAYREAHSLETLLPRLLATLTLCVDTFEILVVDTRERFDDTSEICRRLGARHVRQVGGDCYGDAVRTGIADARGDYILFMDADGSHAPDVIAQMWRLRKVCDIVIASRYVRGGRSQNGPLLVVMSQILGLAFWLAFNLPVADATTSYRLYLGSVLRALNLQADGFDILQEILLKAYSGPSRATVMEIPFNFCRRTAGVSKRKLFSLARSYLITFAKLKRFQGEIDFEVPGPLIF